MAFPPRFLDDLRARVSLAAVVGKKVKLTRRGNEYTGLCPFHKEKTPSFTLNEDKGFYHCFGCGAHGDAISFLTNCEKMSFIEAVETLASSVGMQMPQVSPEQARQSEHQASLYQTMEKACQFFEKMLYQPQGRAGLAYLRKRGLSDDIIKRFRLGFAPQGNLLCASFCKEDKNSLLSLKQLGLANNSNRPPFDPYDYFRDRVIFPIADKKNHIIAFGGRVLIKAEPKYLNSPETVLFHKGETLYALPYAIETMRQKNEAILVEGYMDVIALHQIGVTNAVAPLGTALTENQIEILWRSVNEPVICFDGDAAGMHAAERAARRVLPILKEGYSLKFVFLPDNLDPDEFIHAKGKPAFEQMIAQAKPLSWLLWQILTNGKKFDTPEHFAALDKSIAELLEQIKNQTVRSYYEKEFKMQLKKFTKEVMYQNKNGHKKYTTPEMVSVTLPSLSPASTEAKMLLTYLILFPFLFGEFMERLSFIKTVDKKNARLLEILSTELADNPNLTKEELNTILQTKYSKNIFIYLATELEALQRADKMPEEARRDFEMRITALEQLMLDEEIKRQMEEFKKNPTQELWTHILSLKQEREKNKEIA